MRIGIDFGTTRIVVAAADRGNYPVVTFDAPDGSSQDWYPPLVAVRGGERRYGFDAWVAQEEPDWTIVRSLKRMLSDAGLHTPVEIGHTSVTVRALLGELAAALRDDLTERSSLRIREGERLEAMLGVPANANSNQRFLTADAFRQAGFDVLGLLNEPSAASIELGHFLRQANRLPDRTWLLVYDLGGGTFDASLVEIEGHTHRVHAADGIPALGGDDFDELMADLALDTLGAGTAESLSAAELFHLHEECRTRKEGLRPNTRRAVLDLAAVRRDWPEVPVSVAAFYERSAPLVDQTVTVVERLLTNHGILAAGGTARTETGADSDDPDGGPQRKEEPRRLDVLYVIGGGSELPLVARQLRERFGRRVRRSAHPRSATAIGLAIQAGAQAGYRLRDRFTRHFGVWREADAGTRAAFDPLFPKGTPLPGPGEPPVVAERHYRPAHNIGHFRYLECSQLTEDGRPAGDLTFWDEIRFPFDPTLRDAADVGGVEVALTPGASSQEIEERCVCDGSGRFAVTLSNVTAGYSRRYDLARWGVARAPVRPGVRRRRPRTRTRSHTQR
jgi:molecular chaperone DnaK